MALGPEILPREKSRSGAPPPASGRACDPQALKISTRSLRQTYR